MQGGDRLPADLLTGAIEGVSRGLGAARAELAAAAGQLEAVRQAAWCEAALAAADAVISGEGWHRAWFEGLHPSPGGGGAYEAAQAGYQGSKQATVRLLNDDLLPLLGTAVAQQSSATGFCLAPHFRALLDMGARRGRPSGQGMVLWVPGQSPAFCRHLLAPRLIPLLHSARRFLPTQAARRPTLWGGATRATPCPT